MSVLDDIKSRLDIVDVISSYVALHKSGRNMKGLCPFHAEKTPSFIVSPERQSWHCFGACATGGDIFSFVMRAENLSFEEALHNLADKAGITIGFRREATQDAGIYQLNNLAASFYNETLNSSEGQHVRDYLAKRGISPQSVSLFQLGYSPAGGDRLKQRLKVLGADLELAVASGLLRKSDDGSMWDFFRGRLMFPIQDKQGQVAGFGARTMDGSEPKYLNTAATPIFDKRNMLYGLYRAAASIREKNTGVIVEGYMDCITAHQYGFSNVVASMGTALTERQVTQLKSLAKDFVLALDSDEAGQEATIRSLESSWRVFDRIRAADKEHQVGSVLQQREEMSLRIATLPPGLDPDEVIKRDPKEWEKLVDKAEFYLDYVIQSLTTRYDLASRQGATQAADAVLPLIVAMDSGSNQAKYLGILARTLDVSLEELEAAVRLSSLRQSRKGRQDNPIKKSVENVLLTPGDRDMLEEYTVALLIKAPGLKSLVDGSQAGLFRKSENREIFNLWLSTSNVQDIKAEMGQALDERYKNLLQIPLSPVDRVEAEAALKQCLRRLEERNLKEMQDALLLSEDAKIPLTRELEQEIIKINVRLKELHTKGG